MDNNGFIFTLDAALGFIIIFILLAAVTSASNVDIYSSQQVRISHDAQDTLETMASYKNGSEEFTVLQNVAVILAAHNNAKKGIDASGQVAGAYLNQTLGITKYNFTEVNQLNGTIAANADMKDAGNVAVGVRNYDNYTFKLYIWD